MILYFSYNNLIPLLLLLGSGWQISQILYANIEINTLEPLNGSCNLLSVTFPRDLMKIKPRGRMGNDCFLRAIAHFFCKSNNVAILKKYIRQNFKVYIERDANVKSLAFKVFFIYTQKS